MVLRAKRIEVLHSTGQVIADYSGAKGTTLQMDLSAFSPVLYFIRVHSVASTELKRVLVSR
jgi:hypothetical protein